LADRLNLAFCVENHLRPRRYPYVRVRSRAPRKNRHKNNGQEKLRTETPVHAEPFARGLQSPAAGYRLDAPARFMSAQVWPKQGGAGMCTDACFFYG
jgi:hypothetical protein